MVFSKERGSDGHRSVRVVLLDTQNWSSADMSERQVDFVCVLIDHDGVGIDAKEKVAHQASCV